MFAKDEALEPLKISTYPIPSDSIDVVFVVVVLAWKVDILQSLVGCTYRFSHYLGGVPPGGKTGNTQVGSS